MNKMVKLFGLEEYNKKECRGYLLCYFWMVIFGFAALINIISPTIFKEQDVGFGMLFLFLFLMMFSAFLGSGVTCKVRTRLLNELKEKQANGEKQRI